MNSRLIIFLFTASFLFLIGLSEVSAQKKPSFFIRFKVVQSSEFRFV